ncbi:hypothetical protein WAE56_07120 [Iodobacter sp. LRB]|uniref:hypothetical protein n=1 Tax=unclassified Iodobacter TaxID=235634 RepID=UPI000C0E4B23|nr:hypothetical protein [Iodobacter sp. BJB302]PHV02370.1 hypothetical protein CSQ88_07520 [Iodobacter sp. BJB302]
MINNDYTKKRLERKLEEIRRENIETSRDGKIYFSFLISYQACLSLFLLFLFFQTFGLTTEKNLIVSTSITIILFGSIASFFPKIYRNSNEEDIKNKLAEYEKNL